MLDVDVAIVGAGGAGLNLLVELDRVAARTRARPPSVALVDPVTRTGPDRTWCFWDHGSSDLDPAVTRSWSRVSLVERSGRPHVLDLSPLRYVMIASADFYALAEESARRLGAVRIAAGAQAVQDGPDRAVVRTADGHVRARWVFDSRPAAPRRPPRTAWLQHFRGWTVRLDRPVLDPDEAVLMDFSAPQPQTLTPDDGPGLAFGYVLPTAADRALVEYTVFSRRRLPDEAYDDALRQYLADYLTRHVDRDSDQHVTRHVTRHVDQDSERYLGGTGGPGSGSGPVVTVEAVEDGAIPMTDAVHARRAGARVFRLGTAGGATRGSTGYTFAAMQRQARAVAEQLIAGSMTAGQTTAGQTTAGQTTAGQTTAGQAPAGQMVTAGQATAGQRGAVPLPPPAYPGRHRWMDAVLLHALDRELVDGPELFARLFARNPPSRVLRFLDGTTSRREDLAVMASTPVGAMASAAVGDALARLGRRSSADGHRSGPAS